MTKDESPARSALKLALEALEETRNALAWFYDSYPQDVTAKGNELLPHVETVLTAIREALAEQPAQQQVFVCSNGLCHYKAQQQEPAAYWIPKAEQFCIASPSGRPFAKAWEPLYTSPPASKPWVGLTDEDLAGCDDEELKQARYWDAKLKEKNT